jgi:NADPH:quinone reductase-like Zn-dependent oxidoreductase
MKAATYTRYGSPDVLQIVDVPKPVPAGDEILIRVRAAGVNPLDYHLMRGRPYIGRLMLGPFRPRNIRPGRDVAGEVVAVGGKATRFKPGDAVFGGCLGAFAEYACVSETRLVTKPAGITFEQAAAVPIAGLTALQGLRDEGRIQAGQKVLVNGAAGGVGTFAVQIARMLGADVTGVCSAGNFDMVQSLGASRVIDYTREDFTRSGERYDLVFDTVGKRPPTECRRALTRTGTLVLVGAGNTGRWVGPLADIVQAVVLSWFVKQRLVPFIARLRQDDLLVLRGLLETGKVVSVIDRRYRLSDVPAAIRYLEEGHARGKIVITMEDGQ